MVRRTRRLPGTIALFALLAFAAAALLGPQSTRAQEAAGDDAALRAALQDLASDDFQASMAAIDRIAGSGHPRAGALLDAMAGRRLAQVRDSGRVVLTERDGRDYAIRDAVTEESLGTVGRRDLDFLRANNRMRGKLRSAISQIRIFSDDPRTRLEATEDIARDRSAETAALLARALGREEVPEVAQAMRLALARINLASDDPATRLGAIEALAGSTSPEVRGLLTRLVGEDGDPNDEVRAAARDALDSIETKLTLIDWGQRVFQGLSLGSVLLLAAVGLAITFGVMGVINLAHGEMLMLGAYTTFVVQEIVRAVAPAMTGITVLLAIPLAFLVAGAMGVILERLVIRHLYGRPLETLLATFGISLVLQQGVRVIFGAPNKEVANPSWMSGNIEVIGGAVLTYNRLYILVFSLIVLAGLAMVLRRTTFGLHMRAVTQNRAMARAMGIASSRVDALTFGLGSGIAGVGGVALSQIGNVSPNLGQTFIVDSFMVVVFGGVGSLWGVLCGAMTLGILNKFLEPYAGAMLGKVIVLVLVILFIQRRPRGLFALKGRAAEG